METKKDIIKIIRNTIEFNESRNSKLLSSKILSCGLFILEIKLYPRIKFIKAIPKFEQNTQI
jgi:hypothetical protein